MNEYSLAKVQFDNLTKMSTFAAVYYIIGT